ncbi:MAG TPA: DUF1987 domain-containing protein [Bacteroidales bacterium]|jgi:hypothetical protein|nr:DUF1987 domain-containing protein [Bacteroidales bacterium]HRS19233.1 DUF1987 domain-containing protein [Bacteroidales bacterium]
MKAIDIQQTDKTPKVEFDIDSKTFIIQGFSRPENIRDFYVPILHSLSKELQTIVESSDKQKYSFHFQLEYFNSSSAKFISDIIKIIKQYVDQGLQATIYWHYDKDDEEMKESGDDFSSISNISFEYIAE